jgi:hypothetical protein
MYLIIFTDGLFVTVYAVSQEGDDIRVVDWEAISEARSKSLQVVKAERQTARTEIKEFLWHQHGEFMSALSIH